MSRFFEGALAIVVASTVFVSSAIAAATPMGVVSWDVTIPGRVGNFDITNLTGANSLPPDFPIVTPLTLSSLGLTVHFTNGTTQVFGSSYFTLGLDGLSFGGGDIAIDGSNPLPTDATLSGTFSTTSIAFIGGGRDTILPGFSATIFPSGGTTLGAGDLAVIHAITGTVPEPSTLLLVSIGLAAVARAGKKAALPARLSAERA